MALTNRLLCNLINIQSVGNKTNTIKNLIYDQNLDICMLTETWLSNNVSDCSKINEMTPKSYNFYHIPRESKSGGGVGIFVKKIYKVSLMNQCVFSSFEYINTKVTHINKNIQIIVVYKPPSTSKRIFLNEFGDFLNTLTDNRNILICGDFNLHFDNKNDYYVKEFVELLESHDLVNTVNEPTSLSNHIIDLVIHDVNNKIVCDIDVEPECVISPVHKLVSFSINTWRGSVTKKIITYRNKTNFDAEKFIDDSVNEIRETDLNCECNPQNIQTGDQICVSCTTDHRLNILSSNYNNTCPEVTKQIVVRENAKWFNRELHEAKKEKRRMEDKYLE